MTHTYPHANMSSSDIEELLSKALVGRLGTYADIYPYVVAMCYVYYNSKIYFHCATQGKKIQNMKSNPEVCFEVDEYQLARSSNPCNFTMYYQSVIVFGKVQFVKNVKKKLRILQEMTKKYGDAKLARLIKEATVKRVEIGEITITEITGKKNAPM